jgi:PAS domain S-box-containing protein
MPSLPANLIDELKHQLSLLTYNDSDKYDAWCVVDCDARKVVMSGGLLAEEDSGANWVLTSEAIAQLAEKDSANGAVTIQLKDGSESVCFDANRISNSDGTRHKVVGFRSLQTLHKRIEKLEADNDRLNEITSSTGLGTWEWNVQTGETIFNERWAEIVGYTLAEIQPTTIETWMHFAHPDDLEESNRLLQEHWAGKTDFYICEARMKHRSGEWVWVYDIGKVVTWTKDGEPEWMRGSHQDITDRKKYEILLERYKIQLDHTNEVARIGAWEVSIPDNKVTWSAMTRAIHEVDDNNDVAIAGGINFYKEGYSRKRIKEVFGRCVMNEEPYDEQLQIITAKGNERWVRSIGLPEVKNGQVVRVYGVFQDITAQKELEEDLRTRKEMFKRSFQNAPTGFATVDTQGRFITVNERFEEIFGYTKEEIAGRPFKEITHPDDLEKSDQLMMQVSTGKIDKLKAQKRYVSKSGETIWSEVSISVIKDREGKVMFFLTQISDQTARQIAEERIRKHLKRLHASEQVAIIESDQTGRITLFNRGAEHLLGYQAEEVTGKLAISHFIDTVQIEERLLQIDKETHNQLHGFERLTYFERMPEYEFAEWNLRTKDGSTRPVLLSINALEEQARPHCDYLFIATDIQKQKAFENELRQLLDLTRNQNERLSNFAHIVSHNLRSHSGNLKLLLNLMRDSAPENTDNEYFPMLEKASTGLSETIEHLSEVAAINQNSQLPQEPIPLFDRVQRAVQQLNGVIHECGAKVDLEIEQGLLVSGIPAYIDSVCNNLISNALKYRSPDRQLHLHISAKAEDEFVLISFDDNGLGFDAEANRSRVFKMYKTFHRNKDSRGVGLFITRSQIEAMNGSIDVTSTPGKGTTFQIKLPHTDVQTNPARMSDR